MKRAGGGGRER